MINYLNKRIGNQKHGFTLVELMIAFLLGSLLMMSFLSLNQLVGKKYVFDTGLMDIHAGGRNAMDWINKDIREAIRIANEAKSFGAVSITTSNSKLVLELPCIDGSGLVVDLCVSPNSDFVAYQVVNQVTSSGKNLALLERYVDANNSFSNRSETKRSFVISETPTDVSGNSLSLASNGSPLLNNTLSSVSSLTVTLSLFKSITGAPNNQSVSETLSATIKLRNKS